MHQAAVPAQGNPNSPQIVIGPKSQLAPKETRFASYRVISPIQGRAFDLGPTLSLQV
jgi:hypothetical protein